MKTWIYLSNPFESAAKGSFKVAMTISNYHNAQLLAHKNDPFFGNMYAIYSPLHEGLSNAYTAWKEQGNVRTGSTLTLDQLLTLLSPTKTHFWDIKIQNVFNQTTTEYKTLFPQGLKPFQKASKENKIASVKVLANTLSNYPELSEVQVDVQKFYDLLNSARTTQLGNKGTTSDKSTILEQTIHKAMVQMYGNLGLCMDHFKEDPSQAELFFDLETIRNHDQLVFTRTVKPQSFKNVLQHTFAPTDTITIRNDGDTDLVFYMAPQADSPLGSLTSITIEKQKETKVEMNIFDASYAFLNVANATDVKGHCIVELI